MKKMVGTAALFVVTMLVLASSAALARADEWATPTRPPLQSDDDNSSMPGSSDAEVTNPTSPLPDEDGNDALGDSNLEEDETSDSVASPLLAPTERVITVTVEFEDPTVENLADYDFIKIEGSGHISHAGEPALPVKTVLVSLPSADVTSVEFVASEPTALPGNFHICPGQPPVRLGGDTRHEFVKPNPKIYSSSSRYPRKIGELVGVYGDRGTDKALIRIFPIQYVPSNRRALFYESIEIKISVRDPGKTVAIEPSTISTVDYLIITRGIFTSALQPLVDKKIAKGLAVSVVNVEDIVNDYAGEDIPAKIRNCIIDGYTNHGVKWVLLAGDADYDDLAMNSAPNYVLDKSWEVPVRYVWNPDHDDSGNTNINYRYRPTDYYYAGLDGTWDDDGDGRYGERAKNSVKDEADWFVEVYVGRLPAQTTSQMQTMVDKIVAYYNNSPTTWGKVRLFGANLFNDYADGKTLKTYIENKYIPAAVNVLGYYLKDGNLSYGGFINVVNVADPMIINAAGHGLTSGIYAGAVPFIDTSTPDSITNSGFLMYAMSCLTNAFDISGTSLGESLIWDSNGGAVAYIGGLRVLWGYTGGSFLYGHAPAQDVHFFKQLFSFEEVRPGAALYESKEDYIANSGWADLTKLSERGNLFGTMLLGDPQLPLIMKDVLVGVWPLSRNVEAGSSVTYTVMVTNYASTTKTINLSTSVSQSGWMASLSQGSVTLGAGESQSVTLTVTAPSGAPDGQQCTVTVTGNNGTVTDSGSCITITGWQAGVSIDISPSKKKTRVGHDAKYLLTVVNTGTIKDTIKLSVRVSVSDWDAFIAGSESVTLDAGEAYKTYLYVTPWTSSTKRCTVVVTGTSSNDPLVEDSDSCRTTVYRPPRRKDGGGGGGMPPILLLFPPLWPLLLL